MAITAACVDIAQLNNATFQDAFQFDPDGGTSWSLDGMTFEMEIKASREDVTPLLTFSSGAMQIVVDDAAARVLHFAVPPVTLSVLPCGEYVYDLAMIEAAASPDVVTVLMQGRFCLKQGVTEV